MFPGTKLRISSDICLVAIKFPDVKSYRLWSFPDFSFSTTMSPHLGLKGKCPRALSDGLSCKCVSDKVLSQCITSCARGGLCKDQDKCSAYTVYMCLQRHPSACVCVSVCDCSQTYKASGHLLGPCLQSQVA